MADHSDSTTINGYLRFTAWATLAVAWLPAAVVGYTALDPAKLINEPSLLIFALLVPTALLVLITTARKPLHKWLVDCSQRQCESLDQIPSRYLSLAILASAALSLFFELSVIRWQSGIFPVFALYKNFGLLACFAGLGLGYALAGCQHIPLVLVSWLFAWLVGMSTLLAYYAPAASTKSLQITPVVEQLDMGLTKVELLPSLLPLYLLLFISFIVTALMFLPLGQVCGRLMMRPKTLSAYGLNLLGSIVGVFCSFVTSWLWTPPAVWFALCMFVIVMFAATARRGVILVAILSVAGVGLLLIPNRSADERIYSPYQLLETKRNDDEEIDVRAAGHYFQRILNLSAEATGRRQDLSEFARYYEFPYQIVEKPRQVAIVGAGTGNDVAAALRMGAESIDAVEIDPAILHLGREHHPEEPYLDPRVTPIVNDARTHFRTTTKMYDMIVYGLLDSHTLLSHAASVRVDSFVYTVEGLREAYNRLQEGGTLSLSFSVIKHELGVKVFRMLTKASGGNKPVCIMAKYDGAVIFLLRKGERLRLSTSLIRNSRFNDLSQKFADPHLAVDLSTDDWPFFYMPQRVYPYTYLPIALIIFGCSLLLSRGMMKFTGWKIGHAAYFFLGAGFMLVETKAITELGLVFGNTWQVIGIAIIGILAMAYLANVAVAVFRWERIWVAAAMLIVSLIGGFVLAGSGGLPSTLLGRLVTTALLTCPMFFSGIVFSTLLRRGGDITEAMAANLLGAMLGGLLEYHSMVFGFRFLYLLGIALYLLAGFSVWMQSKR